MRAVSLLSSRPPPCEIAKGADRQAEPGTGPQGITHAAGFRPAYGVDDPAAPLANALGKPLGITVGQWFAARGAVALSPAGADTRASLTFTGLVPRARYSMFENHFGPAGVTFTPLDAAAKTNSFNAGGDGTARLDVIVPGRITHAEGVLLVFHSDGADHGMQRGEAGVQRAPSVDRAIAVGRAHASLFVR